MVQNIYKKGIYDIANMTHEASRHNQSIEAVSNTVKDHLPEINRRVRSNTIKADAFLIVAVVLAVAAARGKYWDVGVANPYQRNLTAASVGSVGLGLTIYCWGSETREIQSISNDFLFWATSATNGNVACIARTAATPVRQDKDVIGHWSFDLPHEFSDLQVRALRIVKQRIQ